jgi:NTP pyrophosphatase (non-canonical NTP hydrolase)
MTRQFETFQEYAEWTDTTAVYPSEHADNYVAFKLFSEVGELFGKVGKFVRGDYGHTDEGKAKFFADMHSEIGDVLWYLGRTFRQTSSRQRRENMFRNAEPFWRAFDPFPDVRTSEDFIHTMRRVLTMYHADHLYLADHEWLIWLAKVANLCSVTLKDCAEKNYRKLTDRMERGKIKGSGDNR